MVDNSTPIVGPVVVWTLPAVGASGHLLTANAANFPWGWGWAKEPLLSATGNRFTKCPGAMGRGTFTILRDQRQEPSDTKIRAYNSPLVAGQYVAITADSTSASGKAPLDPDNVLWWGWISSLNYTQVQGTLDGIGLATALEVGHILDQQEVTDWLQASDDGLSGDPITTPPTANLGDSASYIVGNATANVGIGEGGDLGYAFARTPADCSTGPGNLWTRWRLLRHLLYGCWPGGLPVPTLACADGSEGAAGPQDNDPTDGIAGFLNDTDTPEVFDLRNLTLKGALDMCVPRSRGFNWTLELVGTKGWQVVVYSYATLGGSGGLPVNGTNDYFEYISPTSGTDLTADQLTADVKVTSDSGTLPDEVVVEGAPIIWGNTVSFADGNLAIGWQRGAGTQEDLFRIAASGAPDYASLSPDQKKQRNAQVRSGPGLRDVYTRYGLYSYTGGDIEVSSTPGNGAPNQFLCPQLAWDGTTLVIDDDISRCPYLPSATLARTIPWPEGVKGDGTDLRPAQNKYLPTFLKPKIIGHDASEFIPWKDFEAQNGHSGYPSMSLDVDDRGMAFNLTLSSPVFLARRHWTDAAGGTTTPAADDVAPDADPNAVDFTTLLATVGVESDQRVRVRIKRPGVTDDSQVRRRLVLREPYLQCWMMRFGAIIGLLPDGTPERITGGGAFPTINGLFGGGAIAVRNDFPAAQKRCDMAAAWAFRERNSIRVERASPDEPPVYARIGYLITDLIESPGDRINAAAKLTVNTVVEDVTYDFTAKPRVVISTTLPEMIGFAQVQAGSIGGGSVSASLGGTVGQAVQTQQQTTSALNRDTQRVPIVQPQFAPASSGALSVSVKVHQIAHGFAFGTAVVTAGFTSWAAVTVALASQYTPLYITTIGVVVSVSGPDDFVVGLSGQFSDDSSIFGIGILGAPYFLTSTPGSMSQNPGLTRDYALAICVPLSATSFYIYGARALQQCWSMRDLMDTQINYVPGIGVLTDGHVLSYNATDKFWENKLNSVANLADATVASPANGDLLTYDSATSKWKNAAASGGTHAATSVVGRSAGTSGASADITASVDNTVLIRTAGTLGWGTIPNAALANSTIGVTAGTGLTGGGTPSLGGSTSLSVGTNAITFALLAQGVAYTVVGNPTSATANCSGITASADGKILQRQGTSLGFFDPPSFSTASNFTSSTSFTVPANVYVLYVMARGAGGGGGGSAASGVTGAIFAGGGGGAGGTGLGFIKVVPGATITITIGAAGTAGTAGGSGGAGGDTTVSGGTAGGPITGGGGSGGQLGTSTSNGAGGTGGSAPQGTDGDNGLAPALTTCTSTGTAIASITFAGGKGGGPGTLLKGSGGSGGANGANGTAGSAGSITLLY